jgi:hypothetical protein
MQEDHSLPLPLLGEVRQTGVVDKITQVPARILAYFEIQPFLYRVVLAMLGQAGEVCKCSHKV